MALALEYGVFVNGEMEPRFISTDENTINAYLDALSVEDWLTAIVLERLIDDAAPRMND